MYKRQEQGYARAQFNLGFMYYYGRGVPRDFAEVVKWYRMAAEQGHARAQYNLGLMYRRGQGVPQDETEAVKWYRKAAAQGHGNARNSLDSMRENGKGVLQDNTWQLIGPFKEGSGISICQAISSEGLGLRMRVRAEDGYLMAFRDLQASDHAFIKDILEEGELRAVVQAGMEYAYTVPISIFDRKTASDGRDLYMIGFQGGDFHLIDEMKRADNLYIVFAEDWAQRIFSLRTDDYDVRYSLKGSSNAINWLLDCAG